jgi:uncharacterized SAM-binding protein YcdF (DUF218 family)
MKLKNNLKIYRLSVIKLRNIIVDKTPSCIQQIKRHFNCSSNKKIYIGIIGCILFFSFVILNPITLRQIGSHLVYSTGSVKKADVLIVLSGGHGERVKKGSLLFEKEYANKIIFTGGPLFNNTFPFYMKKYAISLKVPSKNISLETNSFSTMDHPINLNPILEKMNTKSIIIVTSAYHTNRSFKTFKKYLNPSINIQIVAAPDSIDYKNWWKHHEMAEQIIVEWVKTICYGFKYGIF